MGDQRPLHNMFLLSCRSESINVNKAAIYFFKYSSSNPDDHYTPTPCKSKRNCYLAQGGENEVYLTKSSPTYHSRDDEGIFRIFDTLLLLLYSLISIPIRQLEWSEKFHFQGPNEFSKTNWVCIITNGFSNWKSNDIK